MTPEVTFGEMELDEHTKAGIRGALRLIVWQHPVAAIEVVRQLSGGFSGARVLQIRLRRASSVQTRVVKIADADEMNREWQAYQRWIAPYANACFAPLRERTPNRAPGDPARKWTALVYDHAGQFAGVPSETVRTLEELGEGGLRELATAVNDILDRTAHVLHRRCEVVEDPLSLRAFNTRLGANLELEIEQLDSAGVRHLHGPAVDYPLLQHDEVLRRTTRGTPNDLAVGTRVALSDLRLTRSGDALLAIGDDIEVTLRMRGGTGAAELADGASIAVWGRVIGTRGLTHRSSVARAMGSATREHAFADPFAVLPDVLCDTQAGRVRSVCHGDLNLRNVLAAGDKLCLIDYARTGQSAQQVDFCWLEIGTLRDVLAGWDVGELLCLHRCLAMATVLLELGHDVDAVTRLMIPLVGDQAADAFRLVLGIRNRALSCYPAQAGPRCSAEYLRHLLLAAHRTVKWPDEMQTPAKVRTVMVAAAVATEWLDGENPFRYWDRTTLSASLVALAPMINLHDDAVRLLAELVSAIETHGRPDSGVEAAVATAATRLVEGRCGAPAQSFLIAHQWQHGTFVDLPTAPSGPGVVTTLLNARDVTLVGGSGSGKSSVARELACRLAMNLVTMTTPTRLPLLIEHVAVELSLVDLLAGWGLREVAAEVFALGAVHLIVDADATRSRAFVNMVRDRFPRTRIVVCARGTDAGSARAEELLPLSYDDMVAWISSGSGDRADAEHLLRLLLDDPRWTWVDLRRPRWLAAVTRYVREHGLPDRLPAPHEVVASTRRQVGAWDVHLHQSYERARELTGYDADAMVDAALRTTDQDAFHILVTLPDVSENLVRRLGHAIEPQRPVMAAELFRAAGLDAPEIATRMLEVLRSQESGPLRWRAAAHALCALDGRRGLDGLVRTAVDPSVPLAAAQEALTWLGRLYEATLARPRRRAVAAAFADVLRQVLDSPGLTPRRESALEILTITGLSGLELYTAQLIDEAQPWPVLRGAVLALRTGGIALPPRLMDTYNAASHTRLAALDQSLPSLTTRTAMQVARERRGLVTELALSESLPWLLHHRFAFDTCRDVVRLVDLHLPDSVPPKKLRRDLEHGDEVEVRAAAHRLLRDEPDMAGRVLTRLPGDASSTQLFIAAAAMPHAATALVHRVAVRFEELLPDIEADRMAGMAALIRAIHHREGWLGMRLARSATTVLVERDLQERHGWPWSFVIANIYGPARDLDDMLCAGGEQALAAVSALASRDFHRSARAEPPCRLGEPARGRLLDLPRTVDWALVAGAAGLIEALPELPTLIEKADRVVSRGSALYGLLEQAEAADMLAVLGYLARLAHDKGVMSDEVAAAQRFLREFEVSGRHPSVTAGRLIGLAYLGDWPLILGADLTDPRMRDAARHAIERWLPGPATRSGYETPRAVVRWITALLYDESVPIRQRWELEILRQRVEQAAGGHSDR